jgi:hypothetical protein
MEAPRGGGGGLVPMATMEEAHPCTGRTFGTMELSNTQKWTVIQVVISLPLKSLSYWLATHLSGLQEEFLL